MNDEQIASIIEIFRKGINFEILIEINRSIISGEIISGHLFFENIELFYNHFLSNTKHKSLNLNDFTFVIDYLTKYKDKEISKQAGKYTIHNRDKFNLIEEQNVLNTLKIYEKIK